MNIIVLGQVSADSNHDKKKKQTVWLCQPWNIVRKQHAFLLCPIASKGMSNIPLRVYATVWVCKTLVGFTVRTQDSEYGFIPFGWPHECLNLKYLIHWLLGWVAVSVITHTAAACIPACRPIPHCRFDMCNSVGIYHSARTAAIVGYVLERRPNVWLQALTSSGTHSSTYNEYTGYFLRR